MVYDDFAKLHYPRKDYLKQWFKDNDGRIDTNLIIQAMKDHEHSICTHNPVGTKSAGICWS